MIQGRYVRRALATGLLGGSVLLAGTFAFAAPAWANGGDAVGLEITNAHVSYTSNRGGNCTWQVYSDVTVVNLTDQTLDISAVDAQVSWENSTSSGVVGATMTDNGGLQAGDTVAPNATDTYEPFDTTFTIPCAASFGDLAVRITDQFGTGSGDAPFLSNGQALPITAVGGLGLAASLAVTVLVLQRRRRHPRLSIPNSPNRLKGIYKLEHHS